MSSTDKSRSNEFADQLGLRSESDAYDDEEMDETQPLIDGSINTPLHSMQSVPQKFGVLQVTFIIINSIIGAAQLNFPSAFDQAGGIAAGMIIQIVMLVFVVAGLLILAYCSDLRGAQTFDEVVRTMCGRKVELAASICILLYAYSSCIMYGIVVKDMVSKILSSIFSDPELHWYTSKEFVVIILFILVVLPLSLSKDIAFLRYSSYLSMLGTLYIVVVITYRYYEGNYTAGHISTNPESGFDFFNVIPTICFGYQCHVSVVPVYATLKKRTMSNFIIAIAISLSIAFFVYSMEAVFGYLTFGNKVTADVLMGYCSSDPLITAARVMVMLSILTCYPIYYLCARASIMSLWTRYWNMNENEAAVNERIRRVSVTLVWFITTVVLAVAISGMESVVKPIGALATLFIFIFPGLCFMRSVFRNHLYYTRPGYYYMVSGIAFCTLGAFIFGDSLALAIVGISAPTPSPPIIDPYCSRDT